MKYELNEIVQVLEPIVNVWRSATVLSKESDNKIVVNLASTKTDIECSLGIN